MASSFQVPQCVQTHIFCESWTELLLFKSEGGSFLNFRSPQNPCQRCRFVKVQQIKVQAKTNRWLIWRLSFLTGAMCWWAAALFTWFIFINISEIFKTSSTNTLIYILHKCPFYRIQHLFIEYKIKIIHGQNNKINPKIYTSSVQSSRAMSLLSTFSHTKCAMSVCEWMNHQHQNITYLKLCTSCPDDGAVPQIFKKKKKQKPARSGCFFFLNDIYDNIWYVWEVWKPARLL